MQLLRKLLFAPIIASATSKKICKVTPQSALWPSAAEWQMLNSSVSGNLLQPLPPASACDPTSLNFNNALCAYVAEQYTNASFHAADPVSGDYPNWNNDSCLPDLGSHCSQVEYPV
jgi:hypothetical protein